MSEPVRPTATGSIIGGTTLELPDLPAAGPAPSGVDKQRAWLQQAMSTKAGVVRSAQSLEDALGWWPRCWPPSGDGAEGDGDAGVGDEGGPVHGTGDTIGRAELVNLAQIARVLVSAALARTESRGTHARSDHPETDDRQRHRLVLGATSVNPRPHEDGSTP